MKKAILLLIIPFLLLAQSKLDKHLFSKGEQIYAQTCVSCHGAKGETNQAIQLIVMPKKLAFSILTEKQIYQVISEGAHHWGAHSDIMPAFKYVYDDDEIKAAAYYVYNKFKPQRNAKVNRLLKESEKLTYSKEKTAKVGEKIFKRNCSFCHGVTGNGQSLYVEQSKVSAQFIYPYNLRKILLTEDQIFLYAKFGGQFWGSDKTDMPSWKKKYNDQQLKAVAKYISQKIKDSH